MKKMMFALAALFMMTVSAQAMSYEQARRQALFLTDKMAYELNLTDDQYEAAYEINLDYLMGVNTEADLYGIYWERRNLDLSYILLDWQYRSYLAASYFYRPLYWRAGYWHFGIYARYPHRDYFFFGRPHFYNVYRGGHSWHSNGGRSWYHGRSFGAPHGNNRGGMRDGFDRGDYGRGGKLPSNSNNQGRTFGNRNRNNDNVNGTNRGGFGNRNNGGSVGNNNGNSRFGRSGDNQGMRESSTRTTAPSVGTNGRINSSPRTIGRRFGGTSGSSTGTTTTPTTTTRRPSVSAPSHSTSPSRSVTTPSRSVSPSRSVTTPSRSVSPSRSISTPSRSVSPSRSSGSSFGGGRISSPSRSMGSSAGRSGGGGTSHFGGRR